MAPTCTSLLSTYLNNHLGGASTGIELARQLEADVAGTPDEATLGGLSGEIEHDRDVLADLIDAVGSEPDRIKQAAGWLAEKAHRLAVSDVVAGDAALSRLLTTESLALGVDGKLALWLALREAEPSHPKLAALDLDLLVERARDQRGRLEAVRLGAVREAFCTV